MRALRIALLVGIALTIISALALPAGAQAGHAKRAGITYCAANSAEQACIGVPNLGNGNPVIMTASGRVIIFTANNTLQLAADGSCIDVNQTTQGSDFVDGGCSGPGTAYTLSNSNGHTVITSNQLKNDGLTNDELCSDGLDNDPATTGHTGEINVFCRYN